MLSIQMDLCRACTKAVRPSVSAQSSLVKACLKLCQAADAAAYAHAIMPRVRKYRNDEAAGCPCSCSCSCSYSAYAQPLPAM